VIEKCGNQSDFYLYFHQKDGLGMEFTACRGSADISYCMRRISLYFAGQALLRASKRIGHEQNITNEKYYSA